MKVLKFFLIILLAEFSTNVMSFNPLLTYSVRFKQIKAYPNITINYIINSYNGKEYINGYASMNTKEIVNKTVAIFDRCNPEGINCEYFQSWELTDLCVLLRDKNQVWSSWYNSYDPPMVCPIDKINYRLINATIDVGPIIRWYPDVTNYQWKVTQKMYAGKIFVGSYMIHLQIFGYRKRNKPL